ncbi:HK97 family phage prohead protease [Streptomyces erythrochromogenes]|uniref:HK97 family phage prohead protease n=1 Tax=Streptomyces erythrochromogenes TaxID=285574 RepID=UPI002256C430|nr:HK97 family phage prohead protease [Streptomyces erythrochromogenes]MCX5584276.1 HK97 family phage prohead protease [Streptomyces erythrochromogenes]
MGTVHAIDAAVIRSAPFRAEGGEGGDGQTLAGYAAVFGQATEIDSWEGSFSETIRKGAFRKTIRESTPVMQFDHGHHPLIGSIPIGTITDLREDDHGLYVEGRISDNWLMQPIRDAISEGSVAGMSFRFEVMREEWRDSSGKVVRPEEVGELLWMPGDRGPLQREIIEVRCRELGPVVFPAYAGTEVSVRARSLADELIASRDGTRGLRQSLARSTAAHEPPADPAVRREVAAALLFPSPTPPQGADRALAAPPAGHPAVETTDQGAPLEREHPPTPRTIDAPPSDGHPSSPDDTRSARLRNQIREIAGLMKDKLPPIEKEA